MFHFVADRRKKVGEVIIFLLGIYLFILALDGFKSSWGLAFSVDGELAQSFLLKSLNNRLVAFFAGLVITTLLQSSSATIALIISTVGSGVISIETSIPMILGANLGTTVTNTIVALGHATRKEEFLKVAPAAVVDDIFKVYNILIFFLLELSTGFLQGLSRQISVSLKRITASAEGGFPDFIGIITEPIIEPILNLFKTLFGESLWSAAMAAILFFLLLILGLRFMGKSMQELFQETATKNITRVFSSRPMAVLLGFGFSWILQSSSVTTSLILPFVAHGHVQLVHVYYYAMGAAVGTTSDAGQIISYLKFGIPGIAAGVVHIAVNVLGVLMFLFIPGLNKLPVITAQFVAEILTKSKYAVALFIAGVVTLFYVIPIVVILIF